MKDFEELKDFFWKNFPDACTLTPKRIAAEIDEFLRIHTPAAEPQATIKAASGTGPNDLRRQAQIWRIHNPYLADLLDAVANEKEEAIKWAQRANATLDKIQKDMQAAAEAMEAEAKAVAGHISRPYGGCHVVGPHEAVYKILRNLPSEGDAPDHIDSIGDAFLQLRRMFPDIPELCKKLVITLEEHDITVDATFWPVDVRPRAELPSLKQMRFTDVVVR